MHYPSPHPLLLDKNIRSDVRGVRDFAFIVRGVLASVCDDSCGSINTYAKTVVVDRELFVVPRSPTSHKVGFGRGNSIRNQDFVVGISAIDKIRSHRAAFQKGLNQIVFVFEDLLLSFFAVSALPPVVSCALTKPTNETANRLVKRNLCIAVPLLFCRFQRWFSCFTREDALPVYARTAHCLPSAGALLKKSVRLS